MGESSENHSGLCQQSQWSRIVRQKHLQVTRTRYVGKEKPSNLINKLEKDKACR